MLCVHFLKHSNLHAACCLAAGLAASLAASQPTAAAAAAAREGLGRGFVELREVQRHLDDGAGPMEEEKDEQGQETEFGFFDDDDQEGAAFMQMFPAPASTSEEPDAAAGAAAAASGEGEPGAPEGGPVSCEVSFEGGDYTRSPTVHVQAPAHATGLGAGEAAWAVMVDESARYWLHGDRGDVLIPGTFAFGEEGSEGHYAPVHPPKGTGKHRYTVILYKGAPQLGPLLSSLRGTPWNNRKRALGSIEAVEKDFEKQNARKPVELCRCSVYVAHEDLHPSSETS